MVSSIEEIESQIRQRYENQDRIVGIMLANYHTDFVKNVIRTCYGDWDLATGSSYDIFWPGYCMSHAADIQPVNFNSGLTNEDADRLWEGHQLYRSQPRRSLLPRGYTDRFATKDIADPSRLLCNDGRIVFVPNDYLKAKQKLRGEMKLSAKQRIDSLTLVLANYSHGNIYYDRSNALLINLRELSGQGGDAQDAIKTLMGEINAFCSEAGRLEEVRGQIKAQLPSPKMDWSIPISVAIAAIQALASALMK